MLAVRDQENLVHGHQQVAASKPLNQSTRTLQPKTPGNRFPKTPLKIPLQDENAPGGFGGKTILGTKGKGLDKGGKFDQNAFVTPMGPRTRAPLGMKTTNAKTKAFQTPAGPAPGKDLDKTVPTQTSVRRPKPKAAEKVRIEVHGDESPLAEREVEYLPPKPKELPYESDVFPKDCLNYDMLKKGNLTRGWFEVYNTNAVDENGKSRMDREHEASYAKAVKELDEHVLASLEEEWTIGDVPETFRHLRKKESEDQRKAEPAEQKQKNTALSTTKGPATITSKRAASALSVASKSALAPPKATQPKPLISKPTIPFLGRAKRVTTPAPTIPSAASTMRHTAATATSRSTIGYTKGRSASSILPKKEAPVPNTLEKKDPPGTIRRRDAPSFSRTISTSSEASDTTITPARFAERGGRRSSEEISRLSFLQAFEVDDEDLEPALRGALPECMRRGDEEDEEFIMLAPGGGSE